MTLAELIKEKSKKLQDIPDKFLTATEKAQKKIFSELIEKFARLKTNPDGTLKVTNENFKIAEKINEELKQIVLGSDYVAAVKDFASEFDTVKKLNEEYFTKAFPSFTPSEVTDLILQQTKRTVVKDLISSTIDSRFLLPIEKLLSDSVASGAGFTETLKSIRLFVEGGESAAGKEVDGKILQYAKTIAHDSFAVSDRSYTNAVADEFDAEWFFFDGTEVEDSRCWCLERKGKYFYYKEIEAWANGTDSGECGFPWAGFREGTNEQTIFQYAGGWGCLDSIMPVSIALVPMEVIQRVIANGMFVPSEFEIAELGL